MTIIVGIEMDDNCGAFERFFEALFDIITHIMCLKESDLPIKDKMKFYKYILAGIPSLEEMIGIDEWWGGIDDIDDRLGISLIEGFVHEDMVRGDDNLARTIDDIDRYNERNDEIYHKESREFDNQYRDDNTHITE